MRRLNERLQKYIKFFVDSYLRVVSNSICWKLMALLLQNVRSSYKNKSARITFIHRRKGESLNTCHCNDFILKALGAPMSEIFATVSPHLDISSIEGAQYERLLSEYIRASNNVSRGYTILLVDE